MNQKKTVLLIILIFIFTAPAFFSLLRSGFPITQDSEHYLIRLAAFHQCIKDFQIPPRFAGYLNFTYGYPIFIFPYPLFYYIGEAFYLLGFSLVSAVKIIFILSFLFSALFMYLFSREFFSQFPSALSALFYVYAPYRFTDVYIRGSFGEILAFVFIPLVFWSITRLLKTKQKKYLGTGSLSLAALIMSHNVIAFIFMPIIFIFIGLSLFKLRKSKPFRLFLKHVVFMLILSFSLSCFFWLPAIFEIKYTVFSQTRVSTFFDYFPQPAHLFLPLIKNLPNAPGFENPTALQIGPLHGLITLISLVLIIKNKNKSWPAFFLAVLLTVLFLMNPASSFLWKIKSIHQLVQFPWRLLSIVCFTSAYLAAFVLSQLKNKKGQLLMFLFLGTLLVLISKDNFRPQNYLFRDDNFYFTNDSPAVTRNEFLPRWVKNPPQKAPAQKIVTQSDYRIIQQKSNLLEFTASSKTPQSVVVNTVYYPGWNLFVNNKKNPIDYKKSGLIEFSLPSGESKITLKFTETPLRLFSNAITLISLLFLIYLCFKYAKN